MKKATAGNNNVNWKTVLEFIEHKMNKVGKSGKSGLKRKAELKVG